jgi:hypothetical protein
LGVDHYFVKPFHVHSIKDAIAKGLAQKLRSEPY